MNAKCVCSDCNRKYASKKALQQHKKDVHQSSSKSAKRPGRGRRGGSTNGGVDIAPSRIPTTPGDVIKISGEDRMAAFDIKKNSDIYLSVDISTTVSKRLATIARAYQRIRYDSVKVIVTPQASAMTNGGYVTGFIMDPLDRTITAQDLTSSQGSQTKKWYETASLTMPRKTDLLYTSVGEDPRLTLPATWWLISEGRSSSDVTIIVTLIWTVTLTQPTLEDTTQSSFTMVGEIRGKQDNYNLLYFPPGQKVGLDDVSSIIPSGVREITGNHFFRVPTFTIEYSEGTGDTGTIQAHFIVYKTADRRLYYSSNGRDIITTTWQGNVEADQVLVPCGTFCKYVGPENQCQALRVVPSSMSSDSRDSLDPWASYSMRLEIMESLLRKLSSCSVKDSTTLSRNLSPGHDFEEL